MSKQVDVRDFGASGNGTCDDTAAFVSALSSASANGWPVYVPRGSYKISSPLSGFSNLFISGDGDKSEIVYTYEQQAGDTDWTKSLFVFSENNAEIVFRDLKMRYTGTFNYGGGSGDSYAGRIAGVYMPRVDIVNFENVEITGFNSYGIQLYTAASSKYATDFNVHKCRLHGNRVAGFRFDYVDGCRIIDCDLYDNGLSADPGTGYGLAGSSGGRAKNVWVVNCRAYTNKLMGIDFHVGENVFIVNNVCYGSPTNGLGDQNGIFVGECFGHVLIEGNLIYTLRDRGLSSSYVVSGIKCGFPYTDPTLNREKVSIRIVGNKIHDFNVVGGSQIGYPIAFINNSFADLECIISENVVEAIACYSMMNLSQSGGSVIRNRVALIDNHLKTANLGYVPARLGNPTETVIRGNEVAVGGKWEASRAFLVGNRVLPTIENGHAYRCTTAGTTGTTEPTWPTGTGATVTDGTVVWTEDGSSAPFNSNPFQAVYVLVAATGFTPPTTCSDNISVIPTGSGWDAPVVLYENYTYSGVNNFLNGTRVPDRRDSVCFAEANAAPTSFAWTRGSRVYNKSAAASGTEGWVCVRAGRAANPWVATTGYKLGDRVVPTTDNAHIYKSTVAGTSGSTQPTWPTGAGQTVNDGSMTWTEDGASVLFKTFGSISA